MYFYPGAIGHDTPLPPARLDSADLEAISRYTSAQEGHHDKMVSQKKQASLVFTQARMMINPSVTLCSMINNCSMITIFNMM